MTHEEISAAIERLRKISYGARSYNAIEAVEAVIPDGSWVDGLIELLTQADPDTHMVLPRDADGVPIHIGDRMVEHENGHKFIVDGYEYDDEWWAFSSYGICVPARTCTHYHKPTVEDVLTEYAKEIRGESPDPRIERITSEYAERIRGMVENEGWDEWERA